MSVVSKKTRRVRKPKATIRTTVSFVVSASLMDGKLEVAHVTMDESGAHSYAYGFNDYRHRGTARVVTVDIDLPLPIEPHVVTASPALRREIRKAVGV
ncbi:MAG: hypothetical protein K8U03_16430 [Planctomycetia bacterium]|nr:hypothetical protein [Planctomycetia bacterium]